MHSVSDCGCSNRFSFGRRERAHAILVHFHGVCGNKQSISEFECSQSAKKEREERKQKQKTNDNERAPPQYTCNNKMKQNQVATGILVLDNNNNNNPHVDRNAYSFFSI